MATRRRARWTRAAAVTMLAGATLAVSATPATAAPPEIRIESVSSDTVKSGGQVRVRFRVTSNQRGTETFFVAVSGGLRCTAGCSTSLELAAGRSQSFRATLVAPEVRAGEESGRNLAVSVRVGTQTAFDHKMIMVVGTDQPSTAVSQVSGRVRDADGKAVGGARLTVRDSAGRDHRTTTAGSGRFSISSSDSRPIAAGVLTVVASRDGYRTARTTVRGAAGGTATVRLTLAAEGAPSTTPPSPSAEAGSPAVADAPATGQSLAAQAPPATVRTATGGGNGTLLLMLLGGSMIAAGVGALALVLIRRRNRAGAGGDPADAPTAVLRTGPPGGGARGSSGIYGGPAR